MARDLGMEGAQVHARAAEVLAFWFEEVPSDERFKPNWVRDLEIAGRFGKWRTRVVAERGARWRETPESLLAAVILIDQFGRNIFRGKAEAFAADPLARALADEAIAKGWPTAMTAEQRQFLFMPFMHGETMADQARALGLFAADGGEQYIYARMHAAQIARFGRFPQRNAALGRVSTPVEVAFLADPANHF